MLRATLSRVPVPLFGNAATALSFTMQKSKAFPRFANWALPGVVGGLWFVWPAITDEFKIEIGLLPDPEVEAANEEAAKAMSAEVVLDTKKVETAHIPASAKVDPEKAVLLAKQNAGDFTHLETEWDKFMDSSIYGEDEDDDDDDDEDEEEEEEEGEEEEEEEGEEEE